MLSILSLVLVALSFAPGQGQAPGQLLFKAPDTWKPRPPASTMRVAEFVLPKADGDAEDGDVVIYYFGGQGGDVEANINRWLGQMQQSDGRASKNVATRTTTSVNGLQVTTLDVSGTYVAEVRPGSAEHFNKPGFRMRAVLVPTPRGPYFIKMLGPDKTVRRWAPSFDVFLGTLKYQP